MNPNIWRKKKEEATRSGKGAGNHEKSDSSSIPSNCSVKKTGDVELGVNGAVATHRLSDCSVSLLSKAKAESGGPGQAGRPEEAEHVTARSNNEGRNVGSSHRLWLFSIIIVLVGAGASAAFVAIGVNGVKSRHDSTFRRQASELISLIQKSWHDFEIAGVWTYDKCGPGEDQKETYLPRGICSRQGFTNLYDSLVAAASLDVQAICWVVNATHEERFDLEAESYAYYAEHFPDFQYNGFVGFQPDPNDERGFSMQPREEQAFYYDVHMCAPYKGFNFAALDFDINTSPVRKNALEAALSTHEPALTLPLILLGDTEEKDGYSVIMMHPGVPLESQGGRKPQEATLVVVRMRSLLARAVRGIAGSSTLYIYDATDPEEQLFMGGISTELVKSSNEVRTSFLEERSIKAVRESASQTSEDTVPIADRQWRVVVVDADDDLELLFVILGGVIILVACLLLAVWYVTNSRREARLNEVKLSAEAERAQLIVENAEEQTRRERDLNDFMAHEVRNPLAAAITACSFVMTQVNETPPLVTAKSQESVREDVVIIHSSLQYIDNLLRNMLDLNRVSSNRMRVELSPCDLKADILDPVATLLYRRGDNFNVIVECDEQLIVMTDHIRLKQVVLNLANNARKFVVEGFIRLTGHIVNAQVQICVEDSGPGIPAGKRGALFDKYQETLDQLNQGTGVGLSLCRDLTHLMNGDIWLDDDYDSGVEGCPGARFVIDLHVPQLDIDACQLEQLEGLPRKNCSSPNQKPSTLSRQKLPQKLSILFVDDDMILRKLFSRAVKRVAPEWNIDEACNGETAIRMVDNKTYDIIFQDHYMASIEKQLLGTETTRKLRAKGVKSIICGLSANDLEQQFLDAGANTFLFKPFPCEKEQLEHELIRILYERSSDQMIK